MLKIHYSRNQRKFDRKKTGIFNRNFYVIKLFACVRFINLSLQQSQKVADPIALMIISHV